MFHCPPVTKTHHHIGNSSKNAHYKDEKQKNNKVNPVKIHRMIFYKMIKARIIWKNQDLK
ncbi:hypothetical protein EG351_05315 [Chryseobacterium bernardetii]|nr:hypothetical protein EG351_05315 [Chryseobacterium bernardetii]